jgi:signal transduction histidine kinase/ActR/RegA family two-component response regulator
VIGKPVMQVVAPESRLEEGRMLERALAGELIPRHDCVFLRADGAAFPLSVATGPVADGAGNVVGLVLLGRDVEARRRLQQQLLRSKRLESAGRLAGGVSHEFNNVLTAILALADLTVRDLPEGSSAKEDLEEIRQQAAGGAKLVRHLLAFSRRQLLRTEVVQLGTIYQDMEPLLQRLVSERVLLAADMTNDTQPVEVDRAQFELVLMELISNAADAMESTGDTLTVTIGSSVVDSGAAAGVPPGRYAELTIQDTGEGMDAGTQARMADAFFTTKGEDHPGLGLAMVEAAVQQHGGRVLIESRPGAGTTVRVLLPAAGGVAAPAEVPAVAPRDYGGTETILLVEDETAVRNLISRSLRGRGYNVIEAKNGEDALLAAERHNAPIHLVLTDVVMPEMGGAELFEHLRRWYPTMRILFISGYTKGSIPPEALAEGAGTGFLPKPFTLDQLGAEVRRVIELPRPRTTSPGV